MTKYVALLRGITPTNPSMRNEKLRRVFEDIGFTNVTSVISSGNLIFETSSDNTHTLETQIENVLQTKLDLTITTIVRSRDDLQPLIDADPFKGLDHNQSSYLMVTFLKTAPQEKLVLPDTFSIRQIFSREICSTSDMVAKTPDPTRWLEKHYGKEITTRTWNTVLKLYKKLE